jgi:hypothetical protein
MSSSNGSTPQRTPPETGFWIYPWDLADEGISRVADRIAETGAQSVSAAVAYHNLRAICPHNPAKAVVHAEGGALYIPPHHRAFETGGIQPYTSQEFDTELWPRIAQILKSRGIKLNAWAVLTHNTRLGTQYPHCVVQNAYGDRYPFALCPANPQVQHYITAVCQSAAQLQIFDRLELESLGWMGMDHSGHHAKTGIELDTAHKWLLSLCFCQHCTMALLEQEVDIERALSIVRQRLRLTLADEADPVHPEPAQALAEILGEDLRDTLLNMRQKTVLTLLRSIAHTLPQNTRISLMVSPNPYSTGAGAPVDHKAASAHCSEILIQAFTKNPQHITQHTHAVSGAAPVCTGLQTLPPHVTSEQELTNAIHAASTAGARRICLYHYGLMPLNRLRWVKSALRHT